MKFLERILQKYFEVQKFLETTKLKLDDLYYARIRRNLNF